MERKWKIKWFLKSFALNAVKVVNHYCKSVSPHAVGISTLKPAAERPEPQTKLTAVEGRKQLSLKCSPWTGVYK